MATERYGPFTLGPGASWYYWFNAPPKDRRPRHLVPQPDLNTVTGSVFVPEYWVGVDTFRPPNNPQMWAPVLSYRILIANRDTNASQRFNIASYVFSD